MKKVVQVQVSTGGSEFKKTLDKSIQNTHFLKNRLLHI